MTYICIHFSYKTSLLCLNFLKQLHIQKDHSCRLFIIKQGSGAFLGVKMCMKQKYPQKCWAYNHTVCNQMGCFFWKEAKYSYIIHSHFSIETLKTQPRRNTDNSFVQKQQTGLLISWVRGEATINNDLQMVCHQIHALTRR